MADAAELALVTQAVALVQKELPDLLPEAGDDTSGLRGFEITAARLLPSAIDETLAARPWPSATRTAKLLPSASYQPPTADVLGEKAFAVPNDFLRFIRAHDDAQAVWQGAYVAARAGTSLTIDYVARLRASELRYDPLLVSAIAARLAWRASRPLADARTTQKQMEELADVELRKAWGSALGQQTARMAPLSHADRAMSGLDPDNQEGRFRR